MGDKRTKSVRGMTLLEVLVATVVISVSAVGVLSYEYHAAKQAKIASVYADAVRIGNFLLEDWKANGGSTLYANSLDEIDNDLGMGFTQTGPGVYRFTANNIPMQVKLSYSDLDPPRLNGAGYRRLIPLRVTVRWGVNFTSATIDSTSVSQLIVLNTFARVDQAGG
jgi:prepilin-type N-terminal cleavage/methylation domain-containing protein